MTAKAQTTANINGSPYPNKPAWVDRVNAEQARDDRDHDAAEHHRVRNDATASDGATVAADALADLRRVMADNADVLTSSGVLAHVARFADARGAERYATVLGVLMRTVLAVPPQVVLPPIIGGEVSLNLLLTVVGGSGAGKGTADKTAAAAVRPSVGGRRAAPSLPMIPVGTGEGINRTYAHAERDKLGSGQVELKWHVAGLCDSHHRKALHMRGKQIKLFLVDGTPGGLTTAEITNWTGHVLSAGRSDLADLLKRNETQRTGVYFLLGDDEAAVGNTRCYIGEADIVADRLRYHHRDKDFWDRLVVITSKDANLTKAHVRYLESKLISLATQAGRVTLDNGTSPTVPALPEADKSDMDYFVSQLQIVLPVLGVNAIRVPQPTSPNQSSAQATTSPIFRLSHPKLLVDAQAQQIDGEFTMLAGSSVVASWHGVGKAQSTKKAYASYRAQHQQLVANGAVAVEGGTGRVTRNIVFPSPSTAGAVALGRSCNGRREWITSEGETFGEWESRGVE